VSALPQESDVDLFGNGEGVIDLYTQVADGALNFGMAKQELDGPEVAGPPVDQGRFGSSKRMRTEESRLQSNLREPVVQEAGILAGGQWLATTTGKQPLFRFPLGRRQIGIHGVSGLLGDLEPDGPTRLSLLDSSSLDRVSVWSYVLEAEPYQITSAELAVYSEVEESQVAESTIELQARAYRPDMLWLERWLCTNKLAFVPGALWVTCCS
jgi:hypothetical protein